jgi:hypothetical protein
MISVVNGVINLKVVILHYLLGSADASFLSLQSFNFLFGESRKPDTLVRTEPESTSGQNSKPLPLPTRMLHTITTPRSEQFHSCSAELEDNLLDASVQCQHRNTLSKVQFTTPSPPASINYQSQVLPLLQSLSLVTSQLGGMALRFQFQELVKTVDIIFSCAVCQRTLPDIYPTRSDKEEATECRLWMAECGHVICGDHLPHPGKSSISPLGLCAPLILIYAGVSFHKQGSQSIVTCPVCRDETNDGMERKVFEIIGPDPKAHKSNIPPVYFETPPYKLDKPTPQFSAMMVRVPHCDAHRCY